MQGSLGYQLTVMFNVYYLYVWFLFEFFIFIYKGLHLPYPKSMIAGEIIVLFLLLFIDRMRLFMSSMGNKTERLGPLVGSVILGAIAMFGFAYFAFMQIYVLRLELVLTAIAIGLTGIGLFTTCLLYTSPSPRDS
eukprot:TRINITY_DN10316_c0_g1_i2.p1 TRINITY_DN10316_c0_g1~~TRINITY_DN10316_c0_g1_i2.p1  ORF type:complete len:135 (+),score=27.68 TRINITY_DN10316_c0_g1_i2:218-622(+)